MGSPTDTVEVAAKKGAQSPKSVRSMRSPARQPNREGDALSTASQRLRRSGSAKSQRAFRSGCRKLTGEDFGTPRALPARPVIPGAKVHDELKDQAERDALVASSLTVKQMIEECALIAHAGLPAAQQAHGFGDLVEKLMKDRKWFTQMKELAPRSSELKKIDEHVVRASVRILQDLTPSNCRVFVGGRQHSGRSIVLKALQRVFLHKIEAAGETPWLLVRLGSGRLREVLVNSTFDAMVGVEWRFAPVFGRLKEWLLRPQSEMGGLLEYPGIDHDEDATRPGGIRAQLEELSRQLHAPLPRHPVVPGRRTWRTEEDASGLLQWPSSLARVFGFAGAVLVIDDLDRARIEVDEVEEPVSWWDSRAERAAAKKFIDLTSDLRGFRNGPFFVGADLETAEGFERTRFLSTHGIVDEELSTRRLQVEGGSVVVEWSLCRGCPGYCAEFLKLAARADVLAGPALGSDRPLSKGLAAKFELLALEVGRFLRVLHADGRGEFTPDQLAGADEVLYGLLAEPVPVQKMVVVK